MLKILKFSFLFLYLSTSSVFNMDENILLKSFKEDVVGDRYKEHIRLEGELFNKNSNYYHRVWVHIESPLEKSWKIALSGGYRPKLFIIDLNNDDVNDLFYQVSLNNDYGKYKQQLYTLKGGKVQPLTLPNENAFQAILLNNFKLSISFGLNDQSLIFHLDKQKPVYEKFYDRNGNVKENVGLRVKSKHFFEPTLLHKKGIYGLVSSANIEEQTSGTVIGEVQMTWFYEKEAWKIDKMNWIEKSTF